jgi:hypothetical protein
MRDDPGGKHPTIQELAECFASAMGSELLSEESASDAESIFYDADIDIDKFGSPIGKFSLQDGVQLFLFRNDSINPPSSRASFRAVLVNNDRNPGPNSYLQSFDSSIKRANRKNRRLKISSSDTVSLFPVSNGKVLHTSDSSLYSISASRKQKTSANSWYVITVLAVVAVICFFNHFAGDMTDWIGSACIGAAISLTVEYLCHMREKVLSIDPERLVELEGHTLASLSRTDRLRNEYKDPVQRLTRY